MKKAIIAFVIIFVFILPLGACTKATVPTPYHITVVTPDNSPLWTRVDAGCQKALAEIGIHKIAYNWLYPGSDEENPDASAMDRITSAADEGVDVLIIAGLELLDAEKSAIFGAIEAGVQVIWIESNASASSWPEGILTTIMADEKEAGSYVGEQLIAALAAKDNTSGTIGLCTAPDSDEPSDEVTPDISQLRLEGFFEAFDEESDFTVKTLSRNAYGNAAALFGASAAELLDAAEALKNSKKAPVICGFGGIDAQMLDLIDDETIAFSVIPDYDNAGYLALKAAFSTLTGGSAPETTIDPGMLSITKSNTSLFRSADSDNA